MASSVHSTSEPTVASRGLSCLVSGANLGCCLQETAYIAASLFLALRGDFEHSTYMLLAHHAMLVQTLCGVFRPRDTVPFRAMWKKLSRLDGRTLPNSKWDLNMA